MRSSGQLVRTVDAYESCQSDGCDFEGLVEIVEDYETLGSLWSCPTCQHEHDGDLGMPA